MSLKPILAAVLCVLSVSNALFGQANSTYNFLRNDVGARAGGLGGTYVTAVDDPNAIFYNPAGLATIAQRRISAGYFQHLLDIKSGHLSFATEIPNLGFVGAGIVYINYGDFNRTGEEGEDLGTFGANEFALSAGFAGTLQSAATYGLNAKYIFSSIADSRSSAVAVDFGIQFIAVRDRMIIGASVRNLGTQFTPYMTTRESLPLDIAVGTSIYPEHLPAVLMINLHKLNDAQENLFQHFRAFSLGLEFTPGPSVHVRVGYNNERRQDLKISNSLGLAGFSVGGGINTQGYTVDYAFTSYGDIGGVHRVTVSF